VQALPEAGAVMLLEREELTVRAATDGTPRWRQPLPAQPDEFAGDGVGFLLATKGGVQEHRIADGKVRWQRRGGPAPFFMLLDEAHAYVSTTGTLLAIRRADGKLAWQHRGTPEATFLVEPECGLLLVENPAEDSVLALEVRTGETRWEYTAPGHPATAGPVVRDAALISCHEYGLAAVDLATAEERWRFQPGGPVEAPALVRGENVYVVDGAAHCIDAADGRTVWRRALAGEDERFYRLSPAGSLLLAETWSGRLLALHADTGKVAWEQHLGQVHGSACDGVTLYLRLQGGPSGAGWSAVGLDLATGELRWQLMARRLIPDLTLVGRMLIVEFRSQVLALRVG
jgi:outer membrane protein assembly factor BamB